MSETVKYLWTFENWYYEKNKIVIRTSGGDISMPIPDHGNFDIHELIRLTVEIKSVN